MLRLEDNDVLRARIERERGTRGQGDVELWLCAGTGSLHLGLQLDPGCFGLRRRENSRRIEESDFQAILRKAGLMADTSSSFVPQEGVMHNKATLEGGGKSMEM